MTIGPITCLSEPEFKCPEIHGPDKKLKIGKSRTDSNQDKIFPRILGPSLTGNLTIGSLHDLIKNFTIFL